jgi:hypothetical protein
MLLLNVMTLLSKLITCYTSTVEQGWRRVQVIIVCHVRIVRFCHRWSFLRWQHLVEVMLKEVFINNGMSLICVTVTSITILHFSDLQYGVIFVEFLMIRSSAAKNLAIALVVSTLSQYDWLLLLFHFNHVRVWWPAHYLRGLQLHQNLL